jgi:bifunctional oligoribonuclease and PAP phosphatase NrnA
MAYSELPLSQSMLRAIAGDLRKGRKLVIVHGNADPDALGCAYALFRSFPDVTVVAPGGLDRISKLIAAKLEFELLTEASVEDYDELVVVDTSSPDQLAPLMPSHCIVMDHHARTERWEGSKRYYCDDSKRSCAEVVYEMLKLGGIMLKKDAGLALLAGMLTDSGHFRYANPDLLRAFAEIQDTLGIEMDEVMSLVDVEPELSERIAQLKGAQRLRFERIGDHIIAISYGSAFESSVCKSLLSIGSDVAFVGSQRGAEFRVSARARQDLVRKGLHLGRLLEDVGVETSNDGGGHGGAAGLAGVGDVEAILNICLCRVMDFLREKRRQ